MTPRLRYAAAILLLGAQPLVGHATGEEAVRLSTAGGPWGTITLLRMPVVRAELKLTPQQVAEIEDLHVDLLGALRRHRLKNKRGPAGTRDSQAATRKIMATHHRLAADLLSEQQSQRLDELFVRFLDVQALVHPAICRQLEIGGEQAVALGRVAGTRNAKLAEAVALLTSGQQRQFQRLRGAPFEFPNRRPDIILRQGK
jgi:hypothetical protein